MQELVQARDGVTPRYRVLDQTGPAHATRFVVEVVAGDTALGQGEGVGKREAEENAARAALDGWEPASRDGRQGRSEA
ncbi:MAG TPA: putative dsRNA-binding protein [Chloroflexota bacterium]|nr:putative dsRNA-binding protein [Chloroflexota bacterium]